MKIIQKRSQCIGCGSCAAVCPKFFEMAEDNLADVRGAAKNGEDFILKIADASLEPKDAECIKEAVDICPVRIIDIIERPAADVARC